jgi:hypothetical protein
MNNNLKALIHDFVKAKDQKLIREIEYKINEYKETLFEQSIYILAEIIIDENEEVDIRQFAGVLFNNFIIKNKEDGIKWMSIQGRENIRNKILAALASNKEKIRKIVSSVVASIVYIKIIYYFYIFFI